MFRCKIENTTLMSINQSQKLKRQARNKRCYEKKKLASQRVTPRSRHDHFFNNDNCGYSRKSSILVHQNKPFFKRFYQLIKETLGLGNIQHLRFLDVGSGLGYGLAEMSDFSGMNCLGLELAVTSFHGSYFHLKDCIKKCGKEAHIPYVTIHGARDKLRCFTLK